MVANTCCLLGLNHPTYIPTTTVHTYVQQPCLITHKHPDYSPITILLTHPQPPSILMQSNTAYLPTPFLFLNSPIPSLLTVHTHNYPAYLLTPSPFIHTILTLYHASQLPHLSSVLTEYTHLSCEGSRTSRFHFLSLILRSKPSMLLYCLFTHTYPVHVVTAYPSSTTLFNYPYPSCELTRILPLLAYLLYTRYK
jgi:hypothetical protein